MDKLITIRDLTVRYGKYVAIENADLDIYTDDFIGVIGPNGGGKTTLVKAILGQLPYSGVISYSSSLNGDNGRGIGYLPQHSNIDRNFPISVWEVILSGLQSEKKISRNYGLQDRHRVEYLLELAGIKELKNKAIGELSGGQLQRTLLCRALISDPKLLILDEPANFVDNKFENELYAILGQLNRRMAIIMVSHDLGTITSVVKSIVCVNRHVHRHNSNIITAEQLNNYECPIQLVYHGEIPHTVLEKH